MDGPNKFQERRFPRRIAGFAFKASFFVVDFGFGFDRSTGARQADGQSGFADKIAQSGRSTKMREDSTLLGRLEKDVSGKQFDHATPSFEEDDEMSSPFGACPEKGNARNRQIGRVETRASRHGSPGHLRRDRGLGVTPDALACVSVTTHFTAIIVPEKKGFAARLGIPEKVTIMYGPSRLVWRLEGLKGDSMPKPRRRRKVGSKKRKARRDRRKR